jgi:hypothetical protein
VEPAGNKSIAKENKLQLFRFLEGAGIPIGEEIVIKFASLFSCKDPIRAYAIMPPML